MVSFELCFIFPVFWGLEENEWKRRWSLFDIMLLVQLIPLRCDVLAPLLLRFLFLLGLNGYFLKLVSVHLHIASNHAVSDRCHRLVPVLALGSLQETLNQDRVSFGHMRLDDFLNDLGVEHQECSLGRLVVHTLRGSYQPLDQLRAKLVESRFRFFAEKFKNLLDFIYKNDLLGGTGDGPEL